MLSYRIYSRLEIRKGKRHIWREGLREREGEGGRGEDKGRERERVSGRGRKGGTRLTAFTDTSLQTNSFSMSNSVN